MAQSIQEVMTRDPVAVDPSTPLTEVAKRMREVETGAIIVEHDGRVDGLVTDRDIVVRAIAEGRDPDEVTAADVCSDELVSLAPDDTVERAIELVREHNIRRLPVVQDGHAVGIVSIGDLAIERDEHSALADLSSSPANN